MTVVIGTAGHIDHGKTTLLRALTGIDADRLPEERARWMTIDVGYAHMALPDGSELDFVDVPGHDRFIGNMLVGAGEIDAALLVVAADDGPRAQTLEHLELLDALGLNDALAVVTKADLLDGDEGSERLLEVGALLDRTRFAGASVLLVSATTGQGLDPLRSALAELAARASTRRAARVDAGGGGARLAVDRAFSVRGRGVVVTGTLRGGSIAADARLRIVPLDAEVRVRGVQVHGLDVVAADGGRVALNLVGIDGASLHRGQVLAADAGVEATDRLLAVIHHPADLGLRRTHTATWPPTGTPLRLHIGTAESGAALARGARSHLPLADGRVVATLRLDRLIAAGADDPFVLRRPSPPATVAGGRVLDPRPPVGASRRRATSERLAALAEAGDRAAAMAALLDLHGALPLARWRALGGDPSAPTAGPLVLVRDLFQELADSALVTVAAHHDSAPDSAGIPVPRLRTALALELRRRVAARPPDASGAASALLDDLVGRGVLARDGDLVRDPARTVGAPPALSAAMGRLVDLLDVASPPVFGEAVRASGCPIEGVRALETSGRIVRLDADLAYAATAYDRLALLALGMARQAPLTPAAFRDATGSSRRYVMAVLEELDRRGVLHRTPEGHVPGPRAGTITGEATRP